MVKPRISAYSGSGTCPSEAGRSFLRITLYVKFASRRSLRIEQHPGWRFGSRGLAVSAFRKLTCCKARGVV